MIEKIKQSSHLKHDWRHTMLSWGKWVSINPSKTWAVVYESHYPNDDVLVILDGTEIAALTKAWDKHPTHATGCIPHTL